MLQLKRGNVEIEIKWIFPKNPQPTPPRFLPLHYPHCLYRKEKLVNFQKGEYFSFENFGLISTKRVDWNDFSIKVFQKRLVLTKLFHKMCYLQMFCICYLVGMTKQILQHEQTARQIDSVATVSINSLRNVLEISWLQYLLKKKRNKFSDFSGMNKYTKRLISITTIPHHFISLQVFHTFPSTEMTKQTFTSCRHQDK